MSPKSSKPIEVKQLSIDEALLALIQNYAECGGKGSRSLIGNDALMGKLVTHLKDARKDGVFTNLRKFLQDSGIAANVRTAYIHAFMFDHHVEQIFELCADGNAIGSDSNVLVFKDQKVRSEALDEYPIFAAEELAERQLYSGC